LVGSSEGTEVNIIRRRYGLHKLLTGIV